MLLIESRKCKPHYRRFDGITCHQGTILQIAHHAAYPLPNSFHMNYGGQDHRGSESPRLRGRFTILLLLSILIKKSRSQLKLASLRFFMSIELKNGSFHSKFLAGLD